MTAIIDFVAMLSVAAEWFDSDRVVVFVHVEVLTLKVEDSWVEHLLSSIWIIESVGNFEQEVYESRPENTSLRGG